MVFQKRWLAKVKIYVDGADLPGLRVADSAAEIRQ